MQLDEIKRLSQERYTPFPVEIGRKTYELIAPAAMAREKRDEVIALLEQASPTESEAEGLKRLTRILVLASPTQVKGRALVKELDGDIIVMVEVIRQWVEHVKAGGALPSLS